MVKKLHLNEFADSGYFITIQRGYISEDFDLHTHDFSELVVITGGRAVHRVNGEEHPVQKGHVFVVNENSVHGFKDVKNLEFFNIMYDVKSLLISNPDLRKISGFQSFFVLEPIYRKSSKYQNKMQLEDEGISYVNNLLDLAYREYSGKSGGYKTATKSFFHILVVYLSREYIKIHDECSSKILQLADVVVFMEEHFTQPLSIDILASKAYMSRRHFIRVFKEIYGTTPMEYVIILRLDYAAKLLSNKDLNVTQVALQSGFSDPNYFTRIFRKKYNITPSKYKVN